MAENEEKTSAPSSKPSATAPPPRPTITLPPRGSFTDVLFSNGPGSGLGLGFSPGPMTLVSNYFSDPDDCKSFSQLLAGAMASPAAAGQLRNNFTDQVERSCGDAVNVGGGGGVDSSRFKESRPSGLMIAQPPPIFPMPPSFSPATLLDSPSLGLFSPAQVINTTGLSSN